MYHRSTKQLISGASLMLALLFSLTSSASQQGRVADIQTERIKQLPIQQEASIAITGTLVDEKGEPLKGQTVEVLLAARSDPQGCPSVCFKKDSCKSDCKKCCPRARFAEGKTDEGGKFFIKGNVASDDEYQLFYIKRDVAAQAYFVGAYKSLIKVDPGKTEKFNINLIDFMNKQAPVERPKE